MKIVRESLFEVLRDEDEWANREIDRFHGKTVPEPVKKEFDWNDHVPGAKSSKIDDVGKYHSEFSEEDFEEAMKRLNQQDQAELEDQASQERNYIIADIQHAEEYIWEKGNPLQLEEWDNVISRYTNPSNIQWDKLDMDMLEEILYKAKMIIERLKK